MCQVSSHAPLLDQLYIQLLDHVDAASSFYDDSVTSIHLKHI